MSEKTVNLIVRLIAGAILVVAFMCMFIVNPGINKDAFSSETLWEAVHPFHWLFDTLGCIGLVFFSLYVSGMAGKIIYQFTGPRTANSSGMVHVVAIVCALLMIMFFV